MAYTHKTRKTFYLLLVVIVLLSVACDNGDGTELTVDRFMDDNAAMLSEIVDFSGDGNVSPFAGEHGKGVCVTTGKNCN